MQILVKHMLVYCSLISKEKWLRTKVKEIYTYVYEYYKVFSPQVGQWKKINVDKKSQARQTEGREVTIWDITNETYAICNSVKFMISKWQFKSSNVHLSCWQSLLLRQSQFPQFEADIHSSDLEVLQLGTASHSLSP